MKRHTHASHFVGSSLALAMALIMGAPSQGQSAEPEKGTAKEEMMMPGKTTGDHPAMREQTEKMIGEIKAQDAELTAQVAKMNSAPKDQKVEMMAAIITKMVEQRVAMNARMEKMQGGMPLKPAGDDSMPHHPMTKETGAQTTQAPKKTN